jgi:hypothetical protein
MFIEDKHVNARKMLTKPRRCLKCQRYGHYAATCKDKEDTCTRCTEHHCMAMYTITDTTKFTCANCTGEMAKGHSAADRRCPKFKTESEKNQSRTPKNKYKYYLTSRPDLWRLLNETVIHREQQPQGPHRNMNQGKQHTDL